jgi:hypothetical protein
MIVCRSLAILALTIPAKLKADIFHMKAKIHVKWWFFPVQFDLQYTAAFQRALSALSFKPALLRMWSFFGSRQDNCLLLSDWNEVANNAKAV